jgi:hypothetical protein
MHCLTLRAIVNLVAATGAIGHDERCCIRIADSWQ